MCGTRGRGLRCGLHHNIVSPRPLYPPLDRLLIFLSRIHAFSLVSCRTRRQDQKTEKTKKNKNKFSGFLQDQKTEKKCIISCFLQDQKTCDLHYNGFCNSVLWQLFHYVPLNIGKRPAPAPSSSGLWFGFVGPAALRVGLGLASRRAVTCRSRSRTVRVATACGCGLRRYAEPALLNP